MPISLALLHELCGGEELIALSRCTNIPDDSNSILIIVPEILDEFSAAARDVKTHHFRVIFILTEQSENILGVLSNRLTENIGILTVNVCLAVADHRLDNRLVNSDTQLVHHGIGRSLNTLVHAHFLGVGLGVDDTLVADKNDVDRSVADIGDHAQTCHLVQLFHHGGIALRIHIAPDDADGVELVLILEVRALPLQHILAEALTLSAYPGDRQSHCKINFSRSDALTVQLTGDTHKREQVVVLVLPLVRKILLMSLTDLVVAPLKEKSVPGEGRCGIELGDTRGCDRIGGLDVPVTVVDAYDQEVVVMFQYLYLRNIFIQLSG